MPLVAFITSILFIPGLPSAATVPRWAFLAICIPFIWQRHPGRVTAGHLLGALFLGWCALSLAWAFEPLEGIQQLGKFALLGLIFCVGAGYGDLRKVYIAAALGVGVNSATVVAQVWGWDALSQVVWPGGLFFNKNFGAEFAAMVLVALLVERVWWAVPLAFPTLWFCQSRGAYVALGIAFIALIWQRNRRAAALLGIALIGATAYLWITGNSTAQRQQLWLDSLAGMQLWGRGIGSYFATFPEHATRIDALALRPTTAHNDLLQLTYEIGPGSLFIVALLVFALRSRWRAEHYVLVVFAVEGLVGFPLYMPATAFLAALVCGRIYSDWPNLRGAIDWSRLRVLFGQQDRREPRANLAAPVASTHALSLRPQHQGVYRLFLYLLSAVRSALRRHEGDRGGAVDQSVRGRSLARIGGLSAGRRQS
jgi:hypothetical protein